MQLVNRSECSAYDCEFVALAKYLGVPLVTADNKLLREFPGIAKSLEAC
jgi:predicted nucleic acid-binding protein